MQAERTRLARLRRLEKLRAAARTQALAEAGAAEARLAAAEDLGRRTAALAHDYALRRDADMGADLVRQRAYGAQLQAVLAEAHAEIARARSAADARARDAQSAERSRAAVADRAATTADRIARAAAGAGLPLGARTPPRRAD